jgi:predicted GNAT family N-acyltransferase
LCKNSALNFKFTFEAKDLHLHEILDLQRKNLRSSLSTSESDDQGFVTMQYTFDELKKMHEATPHLVILLDDHVIGYALAMPRTYGYFFSELEPMFNMIDAQISKETPTVESDYLVMGQICIAKEFRGTGLFQQLYDVYLNKYIPQFSLVVTEIAAINKRSMSAHKKVGFQEVATYVGADGIEWVIVLYKNQ